MIRMRRFRSLQVVAAVLAMHMFATTTNSAYGQSGGPTQPEVQSFEPIGTNQMVDLFTGDFTYNIPLFNLPGPDGGYPFNLAYHSGIQMEQEASWVGLGWNINVGTINRNVRNLPDDFGGSTDDEITIRTDMRPNWTVGVGSKRSWELFGFEILDDISQQTSAVAGSFSMSGSIYYNNYRGIGFSIKPGLDLHFGKKPEAEEAVNVTGDLGFGVKLDSQEGIDADVTIGYSESKNYNATNASVSSGINSRTGWREKVQIQAGVKGKLKYSGLRKASLSGGSSLSFSNSFVSMSTPSQMRGGNGRFSIGKGISLPGNLKKIDRNIFFSFSRLKEKNKDLKYRGVGYMYYQSSVDSDYDLEDDKRVKDISNDGRSLVHKDTRRLGSPIQTYDTYSVTGQGIGNSFRPHRNDIGRNIAPRSKSEFHGGSLGLEFGKGTPRTGIDGAYNYSHNKADFWPNTNDADLPFVSSNASLSDGIYFQNYGEQSVDDLASNYGNEIAAEAPVAYQLINNSGFYDVNNVNQYKPRNGNTIDVQTTRAQRKRRALGVEAFTNKTIRNTNGVGTVIPEFEMKFYDGNQVYSKSGAAYDDYDDVRNNHTATHVGGYIATNPSGMRYVYGLSAYNNNEKNVTFSVEESPALLNESEVDVPISGGEIDYKHQGTNKYYQSVSKSAYAHSYMLTSILGTDYVDIDGVAGPSEGDLGYWVKFEYARVHEDMAWRAPFDSAQYNKGYEMSFKDGQGTYNYGDKEVWYLATAETKTHIAEFKISPREDTYQPGHEFNETFNPTEQGYYKLERIDVFAKDERYPNGVYNGSATPIKSCHFEYDYSLCQGIPSNLGNTDSSPSVLNNGANAGGKLTLKNFYFTYRGNNIGSTSPYQFEYNTTVGGNTINYDRDAVDRWGNYQPNVNASNIDYPYNDPYISKSTMDERAKLWSISAINLPSGGRYEIDYESDSYAYVQDEVAMHMVEIVSLDDWNTYMNTPMPHSPENYIKHPKDAAAEHRRVYFKLEEEIPISASASFKEGAMKRYLQEGEYMYFKVNINVTKASSAYEPVGGYSKVKKIAVDETSGVGGFYQWGYVELDFMKVDKKTTNFHPFTEVGARHIKYNDPDVLYDNPPYADADKLSKSDIKNAGWSLISNATDFKDLFTSFTQTLTGNQNDKRLDNIELGKSWIRLRTPDKIKYGGGHRVKEIRIIDNWALATASNEATSTYGTVYEYDMKEGNRTISSGVATYEPLIGGDEIPLRKPIKGWEDKNVASKNVAQTYTEEPGNESLFPGASIGYRQVRVMSKNTADKLENPTSDIVHYSGVSVNEFYTAKDYPIIQEVSELETDKTLRKSRLLIPALLVNIDRKRMAATQGYYIELNDMHGKPKGGREIGFNDQGGEVEVSSLTYEYFDESYYRTNDAGEKLLLRKLKNDVDILYSDIHPTDDTKSHIASGTLATELEFIPETRYAESKQISGGLDFNFEQIGPLPWWMPIPTFNWKVEKTGTVVTNKIINKSGILKKTTATQRGSTVSTENLVFDQYTGQPLLTSVNNDYGDLVYGYSILSHDQYESTGPAYKNIGVEEEGEPVSGSSYADGLQHITMDSDPGFFIGDELLATPVLPDGSPDITRNKQVCYFHNLSNLGNHVLETAPALTGKYRFTVIRSGRRNLLSLPISSITALSNPTINRQVSTCTDATEKGTQNITLREIDNVIAINAVELGNHWYKDTRQLADLPPNWFDKKSYAKGMSGVHAPVRTYAYVDDRVQTENAGVTEVDLDMDGVINDVRLFDWNHLLAQGVGCENKWVEADQVTLLNPSSMGIESKNILDVYNAKLYGRSGTEPIAVAANAKNTEIGFESFEEYSSGTMNITDNATTNLNFYTNLDQTERKVEDRFDIVSGQANYGLVNVDYALLTKYSDFTVRMHYDGFNNEAEEHLLRANVSLTDMGGGVTQVTVLNISDLNMANMNQRRWRGELFATKTIPDYPSGTNPVNANVEITDEIAHTGKNSLVVRTLAGSDFLQGRLTLIPGEKYQLSGWFSSPENLYLLRNYKTLLYSQMQLEYFDMDGTLVSSESFAEQDILQGTFIEDWQKFTVNFTMPAGAYYVSVKLPVVNEVYSDALQDYIQKAYYDDIRIAPLDGGMQTYVYNQENQRLEAVLDGNNYATFYYYDDEGNLFLVKRETEKGIITVQESRSYTSRN